MAVPTLDREQSIQLLRSGFAQALYDVAFSYTVPIAAFEPRFFEGRDDGVCHGSGFIVTLEPGLVMITADHVVEACLAREEAGAICQIGDLKVHLRDRVIDRDEAADLATLNVSSTEVAMMRDDLRVYGPREPWPPRPPDLGKGVFLSGYPRDHRRRLGRNAIEWGAGNLILTATSVSEKTVTCQIEAEEMVPTIGGAVYERGQWFGGMSGAPLWTLVQGEILWWRLAGVLVEYSADLDLLMARRPDAIKPDGHIERSAWL